MSLSGGAGPAAAQRPNAPAILDMFWAGEQGGAAIAEVLFGDYNPAGRLPYTVYSSAQDIPPMKEYDITKGFTYMYFDGHDSGRSVHGHGRDSKHRHTRGRRGRAALCPRRRSERQEAEEAAHGVRANQPCSRGDTKSQLHAVAREACVLGSDAEGVDRRAWCVRSHGRELLRRRAPQRRDQGLESWSMDARGGDEDAATGLAELTFQACGSRAPSLWPHRTVWTRTSHPNRWPASTSIMRHEDRNLRAGAQLRDVGALHRNRIDSSRPETIPIRAQAEAERSGDAPI